ncbi:MAG: type II toxin-antitoxin system HipA family toxin [Gammaproteobacteria bacterium]|nr:type II toxin-antitoxin system HipA family toxin [Gammaproteobacteria bacterium]MBU1724589.1 type II toxin-antitoxin system HipA family toxin [Gammaproteobacteria bacterium]MBU2005321.1 type II toxin-antitoxin system HipA family toxin [Gammaproteobacteria bacterium]
MLQVLYGNETVGQLWSEARELHFRYAHEWISSRSAFPLSPHLPISTQTWRGDEVLFFFSNLLPEGAVLDAILKLKRLPRGDVYAQLAAFGEDAAGAFSLVPEDEGRQRQPAWQPYSVEDIRADLERLADHLPLLFQHGELRLSLAGAQDKIPVHYADGQFQLPMGGAASTHILKPAIQPQKVFPDSVLNEAFCLHLARHCGLAAVKAEVVRLPEPVLVVERYDRRLQNGQVQRLHQLDFCQLAGVLPDQKYAKDGGPGLADIFGLIDRYAAVPGRDRLQVLDWVVFNYLIGNADAHAKNLAMLVGAGNRLQLAPLYDLLCTSVYPQLDTRMAMAIGGEYRPEWVQHRHWQRFAAEASINFSLLQKRGLALGKRVLEGIPPVATVLGAEYNPLIASITGLVGKRAGWLESRLGNA